MWTRYDSDAGGGGEVAAFRAFFDEVVGNLLAPEPVILFPETSTPTCIVGVESCGVTLVNDPVRTFWNRKDTDSN